MRGGRIAEQLNRSTLGSIPSYSQRFSDEKELGLKVAKNQSSERKRKQKIKTSFSISFNNFLN